MDTDKKLLKPAEAAVVLGVGRSTLYRLLRTGDIPCVRIGRSVRVPVKGLDAWLDANERGDLRAA